VDPSRSRVLAAGSDGVFAVWHPAKKMRIISGSSARIVFMETGNCKGSARSGKPIGAQLALPGTSRAAGMLATLGRRCPAL
jgi:hypothetical protein